MNSERPTPDWLEQLPASALRLDDLDICDEDGTRVDLTDASPNELVCFGWSALAAGDVPVAELLFRTALELDSNDADARAGLREAWKAHVWLYRTIQRLGIRIVDLADRHGRASGMTKLILFGGFPGLMVSLIRKNPQWATPLWAILLSYLAALVVIQLADYGANLYLRFDTQKRILLSPGVAIAAVLGTCSLLASILCVASYFTINHVAILIAAMVFFFMPVVIDAAFGAPSGLPRLLMTSYLLAVGGCGLTCAGIVYSSNEGSDWNEPLGASAGRLFLIFIGGIVATPLAVAASRFGRNAARTKPTR